MSDIPLTIRVHQDIQTFKDRKQAVIDLYNDIIISQSNIIDVANGRIGDAQHNCRIDLGAIGAEFIDYMSERYALEEPAFAPAAETPPTETPVPEKVRRPRAPKAAKAPEPQMEPIVVTEVPPGAPTSFTYVRLVEDIVIPEAEFLDRAPIPPEVATAVIPTDENPNGQVTFTGQGPVVGDAVVKEPKTTRTFEEWKKTMPSFTKQGGVINLLDATPPSEWAVIRKAEVAGLARESILRIIDATIADYAALQKVKPAPAVAPLDDNDPPF